MLAMKDLILLKAISSIQAQRLHLRIYEQIEILERWKVEMWSRYRQRNSNKEDITCFYSTESDGTVPMKLWKHSGGIAISRQNIYTHKHIQIKGSSMTKKGKIYSNGE